MTTLGLLTGVVTGVLARAALQAVASPLPTRVAVLVGGGGVAERPRAGSPPGTAGGRRWARAGGAAPFAAASVGVLGAGVAHPVVGLALAAGAIVLPRLGARRREARRRAGLAAAVPEVVDLLVVAVDAGLTVPLAVAAVAPRVGGPLGAALAAVTADVARGARCADALDALPAVAGAEDELRPMVAALVASERYGAPLADALSRLADDARHHRRRRAEEAARRLPVTLLFPLVLCTLPAFGLLTVAPLLAGALRSLRL